MDKPGSDPSGGQRLLFTTADGGLEAWGRSRKALFRQALRAFARILASTGPVGTERELPFVMEAPTAEGLLVKILNESLYLWETRQGLVLDARFETLTGGRGRGVFLLCSPEGRAPRYEVKAVTYHGLRLRRCRKYWRALVIVDL